MVCSFSGGTCATGRNPVRNRIYVPGGPSGRGRRKAFLVPRLSLIISPMPPCRVALCVTDLDVGGAEQCLVELATRLDRREFEPVVYCLGPRPASAEASCVPRLEAAGVEVHCLGARGGRNILPTLRHLRRLLASQRPDLVQTLLFHANVLGAWRPDWRACRGWCAESGSRSGSAGGTFGSTARRPLGSIATSALARRWPDSPTFEGDCPGASSL